MPNANNSNTANRAASYTIVFTVDLRIPSAVAGSGSFPSVNENLSESTLPSTFDTWIPAGPFQGCQTRKVKHGDVITAYDEEAYYLKQRYVRSASNIYGILTITTETP